MDVIAASLKDGKRVIHPHQALAMSRQQALETLRDHGDEQDSHAATLMLAGPQLTEQDEINLMNFRPVKKPMAAWVKLAIARMLICAH